MMNALRIFRFAVCTTAVVAGVAGAKASTESSAPPPNIIFMISDDHRWDCLGIAGNDKVKTPHLDRMAREGQWHREFTIQIPSCSPARASLLTGLPAYRNGWYSNEFQRLDVIDPDGLSQYPLLPKEMQAAGYRTAMVGKWHITPDPWNCGFEAIHHWMLGGMGAFENAHLAHGRSRQTREVPGFVQTIFADDAITELNARADGSTTTPLFMWVAFTAPHAPFIPNPEPFSGQYDGQTPEELAPDSFYDDPQKTKRGRQTWDNYYEAISALDAEVGRVMETIRNSPDLSTNTLVVFMGDNGFMMGRRNVHEKYLPYDDALRVPMIVWGAEPFVGAPGTTVTASLNSLDLTPTFVSLAGGKIPAEWPGRDASAVLKSGKVEAGFDYAVSAYPDHDSLIDHVEAYRVIRTPSHKLILWHPETRKGPELYDLLADPAEEKNLYDAAQVKDVQASLTQRLEEFRKSSGDDSWDMKGPLGMFEPERLKWKYGERRAPRNQPAARRGAKALEQP